MRCTITSGSSGRGPGGSAAKGTVRAPGDKSVGHRAVLLSAMAEGTTRVRGLSGAEDNRSTVRAVEALGAQVVRDGDELIITGVGARGFRSPAEPLDLGNSGTTTRLLAGVVAGYPEVEVTFVGDASLSGRPNRRIATPLERMGARLEGQGERLTLPLRIVGQRLRAIRYELPIASAQVKSCVLLAGLKADGVTAVGEPSATRDHTERMLRWFGVEVVRDGEWIEVAGGQTLRVPDEPGEGDAEIQVVGDISSAAFPLALAAGGPGAEVTVEGVGLNPTRTGFLDLLGRMGADFDVIPQGEWGGEPWGRVRVCGGALRPLVDDGAELARFVDEVPLLALLATRAEGVSELRGLAELRVKESDRVSTTAAALSALGARVEAHGDRLTIHGGAPLCGGCVQTHGDHRIAMMAAVAATWATGETEIDDVACVATSYPGFFDDLQALTGARIRYE